MSNPLYSVKMTVVYILIVLMIVGVPIAEHYVKKALLFLGIHI